MSALGPDTRFVLLLVLFLAVLVLCTKPLGSYIADVMEGRPESRPAAGRAPRGAHLPHLRRRAGARDGLERICHRTAAVQRSGRRAGLRAAAPAGVSALEPATPSRGRRGHGIQYRGELHHQYQLAELLGRIDARVSRPDGGTRRAEFPVRRDRHCGGGRPDPRLRAAWREDHRQLLGRRHPSARSTCSCRCPWFWPSCSRARASCRTSRLTRTPPRSRP